MASVRIAYIGGGSTRAPGIVASFVKHADAFAGSEIVLASTWSWGPPRTAARR